MRPRHLSFWLCALGAGLGGLASSGWACGPMFPNRYLDASSAELLAAPEAFFADELRRLLPPGTPWVPERRPGYFDADKPTPAERTASVDAEELGAALRAAGRTEREAEGVLTAYRVARESGVGVPDGLPAEFALYLRGAQAWKAEPAEFALYLRGAQAWKAERVEEARAAWEELLALPEHERRRRSVWAAYMLARSWGEDSARSSQWLGKTRELAAAGFDDALGLAGEAKGWEAKARLAEGDHVVAVRLYLERMAEGDVTAVDSLRMAARRIATETWGESFAQCVRDERARAVVVAWLLARGGSIFEDNENEDWAARAREWAVAIHREGGRELRGADRLAWLAYEGGLFALAEDWLKLAPADSAEAHWLRAKLAARDGRLDDAARSLERAVAPAMPAMAHRDRILAEAGRVWLALDKPQAALAAWMAGGHWEDAAFVAERVLTMEEMVAVVDAAPEPDARAITDEFPRRLRALAARRLARADRASEARMYFTEELRALYAAYVADVALGFDASRKATERAEALARAARTLRERGMELVGTELEPDWAIWGGSFDLGSAGEARMGLPVLEGGVFAPTEPERARIGRHAAPERRFHYRYQAAELAWWAASLMPDGADATARLLWEAGGWLKAQDPKAAEPFYQALVLRCRATALGREAARLKWFPREAPVDDESAE